MNLLWLIPIVFYIVTLVITLVMAVTEKQNYNDGKCPKCGHKWRAFDEDHTGAIGLICDECGNVMWLDWHRRLAKRKGGE